MKKVILFSVLIMSVGVSKAQIDTAAVLNNLLANKSFYVGKQASVLIDNLPLPVKYYRTPLPFPYLPDTLQISSIDLSFITLDQAVNNSKAERKKPCIVIYFSSSIPTLKKLFKRGYILDATGDWTVNHGIYFGQAIVADFKIYGY